MPLTPRLKTALVILLVTLPWLQLGLFELAHSYPYNENANTPKWFWWRVSMIEGGAFCLLAIWLAISELRERRFNPLQLIGVFFGAWFLINWPVYAFEGILRSWQFIK